MNIEHKIGNASLDEETFFCFEAKKSSPYSCACKVGFWIEFNCTRALNQVGSLGMIHNSGRAFKFWRFVVLDAKEDIRSWDYRNGFAPPGRGWFPSHRVRRFDSSGYKSSQP
jgi:hypothetical protein